LDDYGNDVRWGPFRLSLQSVGLRAGVWFTDGGNIRNTPSDADFAIAEMEGPGDYDGIIAALQHLPSCPKAIVTNFNIPLVNQQSIPQPANAQPLISAGFTCLTEAYMGDNPNATPGNLDVLARALGWQTSQPVFGCYNLPLSSYSPYMNFPGWSVYLSEYVV
jgi:hypothetical protein